MAAKRFTAEVAESSFAENAEKGSDNNSGDLTA
jgi:hypothetical protein